MGRFVRRISLVATTAIVILAGNNVVAQSLNDTATPPAGTSAQELGLAPLTDDASPQELFDQVKLADAEEDPTGAAQGAKYFSLYGAFKFPRNTTKDDVLHQDRHDEIFGADISHYTDAAYPIEQLSVKQVAFLYMKTTQGNGLDTSFATFWFRAGKVAPPNAVHRGAYHFLTCGDPAIAADVWGRAQADVFIKVVKANGNLRSTDMPPVVDLEWDRTKTISDRWPCRKPEEIIAETKAFLKEVEAGLKRKPVIYTARAWWRERMGDEKTFSELAGYPIWLADYSKSSRGNEVPLSINKSPWVLWQFTSSATMEIGFNKSFDANVFKGTKETFLSTFAVSDFQ